MFTPTLEAIISDIYSYNKKVAKTVAKLSAGIKNKLSQPFESIVEHILIKHKCVQLTDKDILKCLKKQYDTLVISDKLDKDKIYFIRNPNGSQAPPDFLILSVGSKPVKLECKSSKTLKPVWNCSLPSKDTIYVFYSSKVNASFVFRSHHIIKDDVIISLNELVEKINKLCKEYNKLMLPKSPSFSYYNRKMFNQLVAFDIKDRHKFYEETLRSL